MATTVPPDGADELDVIEMLERDHRRIDGLASRLDTITDADEIRRLYARIVDELVVHESIENEVLFPAFKEMLGSQRDDRLDTLERRLGEHDELNAMLKEMRTLAPDDFAFIKRGSALLLEVEGHFAREEESVFARMRAALSRQDLLALGRQARDVASR
jgi:hemerythrin superfamily protein